jgi:hypothetical protein
VRGRALPSAPFSADPAAALVEYLELQPRLLDAVDDVGLEGGDVLVSEAVLEVHVGLQEDLAAAFLRLRLDRYES